MDEKKKGSRWKILSLIMLILGILLVIGGIVFSLINSSSESIEIPPDPKEVAYSIDESDILTSLKGRGRLEQVKNISDEHYQASYNGELFNFTKIQEDNLYISFSGNQVGKEGKCYTQSLLINKRKKTIEKDDGYSIRFIRTDSGYYFISGSCEPSNYPGNVYDRNWNLLGLYIGNTVTSNKHIFVANSEFANKVSKGIVEYDLDGKVLFELNDYYFSSALVYNDEVYAIGYDTKMVYIFNLSINVKEEVTDVSSDRDFNHNYLDKMEREDSKIVLQLAEGTYYYDLSTYLISKEAN